MNQKLNNFLRDPRTNWKFIWILVIMGFLAGAGILGYYSWWMKQQEAKFAEFPIIKRPVKVEDETANWKTYRNEELGVEFRYPNEWGKLKTGEEPCLIEPIGFTRRYQDQPCVHLKISIPDILSIPAVRGDAVVLAGQSMLFGKYSPGRGGYFGDIFLPVLDKGENAVKEFISKYCEEYKEKIVQCSVYTNLQGVFYTKALLAYKYFPETEEIKALYYLIYHPDSYFPGLVLSNELIRHLPLGSEGIFDQIISTLEFIK